MRRMSDELHLPRRQAFGALTAVGKGASKMSPTHIQWQRRFSRSRPSKWNSMSTLSSSVALLELRKCLEITPSRSKMSAV
jgi:hypothetical protein